MNKKTLPVEHHAWMTSGVFETWLKKFDKRMGRKARNVLLSLHNATSHSDVQLCNVKLKFLPDNTTSILQPFDQGIILDCKYRKTVTTHDCTNGKIEGKRLLPTIERNKCS